MEYQVARWRLIRKNKPGKVIKLAGTVVSRLPSGFYYQGDAESWYVRPIGQSKRGNRGWWDISVEFQEIDPFKAQAALLALRKEAESGGGGFGSAFTGVSGVSSGSGGFGSAFTGVG